MSISLFVCLRCLPLSQTSLFFTCLKYKSFEYTVGKGEIARKEQFLLFPQCFLPVSRTFCHFHLLRTKSVTKKLMNAWQKYKILAGFEPGPPG